MPKISNEVLAVLGNCTFKDNMLYLPPGQLDRALYTAVNAVLTANGGKWNRAAKAHVFDEPAESAIEQALLTGEFHRTKQDLGQFDTPPALADRVVQLADVSPGHTVLEPSAGIGNIVSALLLRSATVYAVELDANRAKSLYAQGGPRGSMLNVKVGDFLTLTPALNPGLFNHFDRVVMNPPFAKQADIDHVLHALKFLKPGGRLVAIMSASVTFRTNRKTLDFWKMVESKRSHYREALPAGAFAVSGTNVNAVIVAIDA